MALAPTFCFYTWQLTIYWLASPSISGNSVKWNQFLLKFHLNASIKKIKFDGNSIDIDRYLFIRE